MSDQIESRHLLPDSDKTIEVVWKSVTAKAPQTDEALIAKGQTEKVILDNVQGKLPHGSYTVILGATGAGKTTLMNYLAGRMYQLEGVDITGDVFINGRPKSEINVLPFTTYVMQDDTLFDTMTVREILMFTARMKYNTQYEICLEKVNNVINQLGLQKCADSLIGGPLLRGVSGGERKRTSIGIELISEPLMIFLDEPTTGLDSKSAENIVEICASMKSNGRTVCSTIHSPNSYMYEHFDRMIILGAGKILFQGPKDGALDFFRQVGFPCPQQTNPCEHFMEIINRPSILDEAKLKRFEERMIAFKDASAGAPEMHDVEFARGLTDPEELSSNILETNFSEQFKILFLRSWRNANRNFILVQFKMFVCAIFMFFCCTVYWDCTDDEDIDTVQAAQGVMFFLLTFIHMMGSVQAAAAIPLEKVQFIREQASDTYGITAYYISKFVAELPFNVAVYTVMVFVIYYSVGLATEREYQVWIFLLLMQMVNIQALAWGFFCGINSETVQDAVGVVPVIVIMHFLLAGFVCNVDDIPIYLMPFYYIDVHTYLFSGLIQNEFDFWDEDNCGIGPGCDPIDFLNIKFGIAENIGYAALLCILPNILSLLSLWKLSKDIRKQTK